MKIQGADATNRTCRKIDAPRSFAAEIARRARAVIQSRGIHVSELADSSGFSGSGINRRLAGCEPLLLDEIEAIARASALPLAEIFVVL